MKCLVFLKPLWPKRMSILRKGHRFYLFVIFDSGKGKREETTKTLIFFVIKTKCMFKSLISLFKSEPFQAVYLCIAKNSTY